MRPILSAILSLLIFTCCRSYSTPEESRDELVAHTTIEELYQMCQIAPFTPHIELKVRGKVVGCDRGGYLHNELFIDDGTGRAKVLIERYFISNLYPEGVELSIDLNGLTIAQIDHILQIGLSPTSSKRILDLIGSQQVLDQHITRGNSINPLPPKEYFVADITTAMCGELVKIDNVIHFPADSTDVKIAGGYHRFSDSDLNFINIYINPQSTGAGKILPQEKCSITGIVSYKSGTSTTSGLFLLPRKDSDIWQ